MGSGWWSDVEPASWLIGDHVAKTPEFFDLWLYLVQRYIRPEQIIVVDSASPVKPSEASRQKVTWLQLDKNYGHAVDIGSGKVATKYCGNTRAQLLGAMFALCNDADIYCYVEQDCVIRGENIVATAVAGRGPTIFVGAPTENGVGLGGRVAAPMHQESLLVVVGRDALERFIRGRMLGPESDGELSSEIKLVRDCAPFDVLAIPFGRSRPIRFDGPCYYAQHLTRQELQGFLDAERLLPSLFGLEM